jgi:hypothetical protein
VSLEMIHVNVAHTRTVELCRLYYGSIAIEVSTRMIDFGIPIRLSTTVLVPHR